MQMQGNIGSMCNAIKGSSSAPIARIKCAPANGKKGSSTITTDPGLIDKTLQGIWGSIHTGNLGPIAQKQCGEVFLKTYGEHFEFRPEFKVGKLTAQDLRQGIQASPDNAPGLDGVLASDLKVLSDKALHWLASMYAAIENGASWPGQTLEARTAWLDKTEGPNPSLDPLEYRGLAILSKVYRLYGAIKLGHLQEWVKQWEKHELFAGTSPPTGAEDAWYLLGLDLELARLCNHVFTGGSADIWKCFDQAQRQFLYHLLEAGGFPRGILAAYSSFHEQAQYYDTIGWGLDAPHRKPCSIPQGCPFSMMLTRFTFHPWVSQMKSMSVIPSALADDLTVVAIGPDHEKRFKQGYGATMHYLHAIGAKPAPAKCFTFSTSHETRFRLGRHYWQELYSKAKVALEARDLGGHLSITARLG